jgi:electron transfer flavoprotein alpha subunit
MQHVVGIRRSKVIVAINNDPNAPIHKEADYSVIADLYQFLPVLTRKLREAKK